MWQITPLPSRRDSGRFNDAADIARTREAAMDFRLGEESEVNDLDRMLLLRLAEAFENALVLRRGRKVFNLVRIVL